MLTFRAFVTLSHGENLRGEAHEALVGTQLRLQVRKNSGFTIPDNACVVVVQRAQGKQLFGRIIGFDSLVQLPGVITKGLGCLRCVRNHGRAAHLVDEGIVQNAVHNDKSARVHTAHQQTAYHDFMLSATF